MPSLIIPSSTPLSAGPKSAAALDFEQQTWREAINSFRMQGHRKDRLEEFLKMYTTPQAVQQTCRERQREANSQYGPVLTKILGKIDIFLAAGDIAVKGAPESVGLAWTGISLALGSAQDDFATFQLFSGACVDIIGILVNCRLFGRMFAYPKEPEEFMEIQDKVKESIPKVYGLILEFSYKMFKYMDRNKFLRVARGILKNNKEEFKGGLDAIKDGEKSMADNATKASQALTQHWQQRADGKQDIMLNELKTIKDKIDQSASASKELNDYLKKELEEQRKKTPMDVARDAYTRYKVQLRAAVDTESTLLKRKDAREEGTCTWIFDTDLYKSWHDSEGSSLLWVSGNGNMGKSVLTSSVIDRLRAETSTEPEEFAHFFYCKNGDDNAQKTNRIMDHLLYYMYELVPMSLETLDKCNEIVQQYLAGRGQTRGQRKRTQASESSDAERMLYFEDAYTKMAEVLKKKIYLVVDALDECSDRKEEELVSRFRAMTQRPDLKIKILVTSRPELDIKEAMNASDKGNDKSVDRIRMEYFNEKDIRKTVNAQLAIIPGMTPTERKTAETMICEKAGAYFGYVNPALELLRRPWQRPIEVHLRKLPGDLHATNARIFESTDPSYIGLLKTCLTYTILANGNQKMKIGEIVDIYSNRFTVGDDNPEAGIEVDFTEDVVKFYKSQIQRAGDTFLDVDEKTQELNLIKPALVKDSFLKTNEEAEEQRLQQTVQNQCQCEACLARNTTQQAFILTKKAGHLEIARQIFKHLNSPLFQKMYLREEQKEGEATGDTGDEEQAVEVELNGGSPSEAVVIVDAVDVTEAEITALPSAPKATDATEPITVQEETPRDLQSSMPGNGPAVGIMLNGTMEASSQGKVENTISESVKNVDEGLQLTTENMAHNEGLTLQADVADIPAADLTVEIAESPPIGPTAEKKDDETISDVDSDISNRDDVTGANGDTSQPYKQPRYEISQCIYHLQMLEAEWTENEGKSVEYEELFKDVLKFFDAKSPAFKAWMSIEGKRPGSPIYVWQIERYSPLHIAAMSGLVELSRRLIEEKDAEVQSWTVDGWLPLSHAALLEGCPTKYRLLKLLLDQGAKTGLDAFSDRPDNNDPTETSTPETPFHSLLYTPDTDKAMVELFLSKGAKVDEIDAWGYNALHDFAWIGKDPEILDLLMAAPGADINIKDTSGETPLHKLLSTRGDDLPLPLFKKFLEHKADINVDDNDRQQALFEVASGGNKDAMEVLLNHDPKPEVDHIDNNGWTALHNAADHGYLEICQLLVEAGADSTKKENSGNTAFSFACLSSDKATAEYLGGLLAEKEPSLIGAVDNNGKTILRKTAARGMSTVVTMLLEKFGKHIDINLADKLIEWTALHIAAYKGLADVVASLLEYGARPELKNKKGYTALELCYQQWELLGMNDSRNLGYEKCVVELINADRDSAVEDQSVLSAAAKRGSLLALEALVTGSPGQKRADPMFRDEFGWTAIDLAKQFRRQEAVALLLGRSGMGRYPTKWNITAPQKLAYDEATGELRYIHEVSSDEEYGWPTRVTVLSDQPIPANVSRYYFEITISFPDPELAKREDHVVAVGLFQRSASKQQKGLELCFPGIYSTAKKGTQSWGYHCDDGFICASTESYSSGERPLVETYGHGDTVGCAVDFAQGTIFMTLNGKRLMKQAFDGVSGRLHCCIGMMHKVSIKTAFTKPFKWKYGDDFDFDSDIPAGEEKLGVDEAKDGPAKSLITTL